MQDGSAIPGKEAAAWLKQRVIEEREPVVTVEWSVNTEHDEDTYRRLLKLLFSPRVDSPAA